MLETPGSLMQEPNGNASPFDFCLLTTLPFQRLLSQEFALAGEQLSVVVDATKEEDFALFERRGGFPFLS